MKTNIEGAHFLGAKTYALGPSERGTTPTAKQLAQINELTRRPFTADELYIGSVMLANDQVDRSYEWFTPAVLKQFAKTIVARNLEMGHEYRMNPPQGLFFDASVVKEGDVNWLKCWYYMPKTDANEHTRAMLDAGVYRYSSIGFAPADGADNSEWDMICDLCGKSYLDMTECQHFAGTKYGERGENVTCTVHYEGKWQAVEGSIVYLGCQYDAEMKSNTEPTFEKLAEWQAMQEKLTEGYAIERAYLFTKSFEGITVPRRKGTFTEAELRERTQEEEAQTGQTAEEILAETLVSQAASEAAATQEEGQAEAFDLTAAISQDAVSNTSNGASATQVVGFGEPTILKALSEEELTERAIQGLLDTLTKAGRVLSAANEGKLRQAHDIIGNVLEAVATQAEPEPDQDSITDDVIPKEIDDTEGAETTEPEAPTPQATKDLIESTVKAYADKYLRQLPDILSHKS